MMARRLGLLGVFLMWMWLGGCFSGGEVIEQAGSDGGLEPDDVAAGSDIARDVASDVVRDVAQDAAPDTTQGGSDSDADGCEQGLVECEGACVDTDSSVEHCGGCGNPCQASGANVLSVCSESMCGQSCASGWVDADGEAGNGCELECEPTNAGIEICDGADNDCNGEVDEDAAVDAASWFADSDGDGFGDAAAPTAACNQPQDHVANDTDCDDTDVSIHTTVDGDAHQDADGFTAGGVQTVCTDGTLPAGYLSSQNGEDCDDADAATNPSADEVCGDQIDNDCDGSTDDVSAIDTTTWYVDCDGDGYAADTTGSNVACEKPAAPSGCSASGADWTSLRPGGSNTDCNDDVDDAFPGQTSWFPTAMNGGNFTEKWDYDCDGFVDHRYTSTGGTCSSTCSALSDRTGWVSDFKPSCGQSRDFQECYLGPNTCDDDVVSKAQECR
jgi:hypothetical protein